VATKAKPKKPKEPEPIEWGLCDTCGALVAWPGADVSCDSGEECDGVYVRSDENGKPLEDMR
jgi:hypothetical protein